MKKTFKLAALFVAAAISVAVVSCNKDKETEEPVASQSQNDESKELLNRIYTFQELRDDINSGAKSGESMTLEELRDNIDLTFNFEHSQHATPFDYATLDTFYVRMPQVDANGNVSAADAIATYNAFETSLENLLANVEDDSNLAKNFSIKFPEIGTKNEDAIQVVFTRGIESDRNTIYMPFEQGDDYIWGHMLGRCDQDSTGRLTDAANELTREIHHKSPAARYDAFYSPYGIEYIKFTPYYDSYYHEDYIYIEKEKYPFGNVYWLFCVGGDFDEEPCMYHYELNWAFNNFYDTHIDPNGIYHYHPKTGVPYYDCHIECFELYKFEAKRDLRAHYADVIYANIIKIVPEN